MINLESKEERELFLRNLTEISEKLSKINETLSGIKDSLDDKVEILQQIKENTDELALLENLDSNTEHSDITDLLEQILDRVFQGVII